jgi:hypothetical protein
MGEKVDAAGRVGTMDRTEHRTPAGLDGGSCHLGVRLGARVVVGFACRVRELGQRGARQLCYGVHLCWLATSWREKEG